LPPRSYSRAGWLELTARFSDPQARLLYEQCQVFLHFLSDGAYASRCVDGSPCEGWAIGTAAGDMYRIAALEHQLADRMTDGACRAAWNRDATSHDQLGEAFLLSGRVIATRSSLQRGGEANRARALTRDAQRNNVPATAFLSSCAPHGSLLGPVWLA
jgi:hypothetical protein